MNIPLLLQELEPVILAAASAAIFIVILLITLIILRVRLSRVRVERDRLRGVATRAKEILATSPDGLFLWDHMLGGIACSRRLAVLLDLDAGTEARYDDIRAKFSDQALKHLERHVSSLRANGKPFDVLLEMEKRVLHAVGARAETEDGIPVADIVWVRDVTSISEGLVGDNIGVGSGTNTSDFDDRHLTALLDAMPFPIWLRDSALKLAFVNRSGEGVVDADPSLANRAREIGAAITEGRSVEDNGNTILYKITELPLGRAGVAGEATGGTVGFAFDHLDPIAGQTEFEQRLVAKNLVFETLGSVVAIFSADKNIEFFTQAYAQMWSLDKTWLQSNPGYGEVLEKLHETRQLPEVADFRAFKAESLAKFDEVQGASIDILHLPDGRAIKRTTAPHGKGGLAFAYEDLSEQLVLERSINELNAVQRATIDNLHEGIAVYGSDGKLKLSNPVYAKLWELDKTFLEHGPHISEVIGCARGLLPPPDNAVSWTDDGWAVQQDLIITDLLSRETTQGQVKLVNGIILDYARVPLPDGAMLLSYLDVTDSARVEDALRKQALAYREADYMKSEFIANVSHEVRTPMNTIIGFADMLSQNYFGELNPRQQDYASGILNTSRGLVSVISDILDLASIEAGRLELDRETFDVHAMLVAVLNLSNERAHRKDLRMSFDCPSDIGWMIADERYLKQVIFNLLSNAITYTPARGKVTLAAAREEKNIVITVSDTGVGIPADARKLVFNAFEKGASSALLTEAGEDNAGVGLGLTIVKSFVELHDGTVEIKSQPGRGTTVRIRMPIGKHGSETVDSS